MGNQIPDNLRGTTVACSGATIPVLIYPAISTPSLADEPRKNASIQYTRHHLYT